MFAQTALAFLAAVAAPCADAPQVIRGDVKQEFDKLLVLIKPYREESTWSQIPWMTDLWEARKKAAAEGKPLVVWTMSGEPLGFC